MNKGKLATLSERKLSGNVQPLAVAGFWNFFFVPLLGFGLLWHVSFVLVGCFFLLVSSFKCFPFERVISFCFVFRSLRFGFVLVSFFLLVFAFLACSLRLFVLVIFLLYWQFVWLFYFLFFFALSIILLYFEH